MSALVARAEVERARSSTEARTCARPDCGQLFAFVPGKGANRKRYCSRACSTKHANEKLVWAANASALRSDKSRENEGT